MNEFEEKDYESARSCADQIKTKAEAILAIFNEIDSTMDSLYGSNWESSGAEGAKDRYNEIRKSYDGFYEKVIAMNEHIKAVTRRNEEADVAASQTIING